jgi:hypothetical protein
MYRFFFFYISETNQKPIIPDFFTGSTPQLDYLCSIHIGLNTLY